MTTCECRLCSAPVDAITATPDDLTARRAQASDLNIHYTVQDGPAGPLTVALLHHSCRHPNGLRLDPGAKFACQIDATDSSDQVVYELFCSLCMDLAL